MCRARQWRLSIGATQKLHGLLGERCVSLTHPRLKLLVSQLCLSREGAADLQGREWLDLTCAPGPGTDDGRGYALGKAKGSMCATRGASA